MSIHLSETVVEGLPQEPMLLRKVHVRLIEPAEQSRFDELLTREHYLKNSTVVGQALRYVAQYEGSVAGAAGVQFGGFSHQTSRSLAALVCSPGCPTASSDRAEPTLSGTGRVGSLAQSGLARFEAGL